MLYAICYISSRALLVAMSPAGELFRLLNACCCCCCCCGSEWAGKGHLSMVQSVELASTIKILSLSVLEPMSIPLVSLNLHVRSKTTSMSLIIWLFNLSLLYRQIDFAFGCFLVAPPIYIKVARIIGLNLFSMVQC